MLCSGTSLWAALDFSCLMSLGATLTNRPRFPLLMTSSAHTTLPSFSKEKSYDPIKDFIPLSLIAWSAGHVLVINPGLPFNSVQELILYAKANPGKLRYGSDLMNITFDPTIKEEFASYGFDDTGNKANKEFIIKSI